MSAVPNLSILQLEFLRQQLALAKEYLMANDQADLVTALTLVQTNCGTLITAANATTNYTTSNASRDSLG